jgi:hypothetical protein
MVARKAPARRRDDVTVAQKRDHDDTPTKGPGSPARFKGKPRGPARFKKRELTRAVKAAKDAGVECVELMPDGRIQMILAGQAPTTEPNPWDEGHAAD